jgi:hypothetical protein
MSNRPATPKELLGLGVGLSAVGLYFILIGFSVLPVPGGRHNLHGPLWLSTCIGLIFLLAGAAFLLQRFGRANANAELASDAPRWMRTAQQLIMLALFGCFALIGSWVAVGGDAKHFSGSFLVFDVPTNGLIARAAFGLGALILWLYFAGMVVSMARKLFGRNKQA